MHQCGGTPVVESIAEVPAGPGEQLIRVTHAGLQPTDVLRARGLYKTPDLPYIIGGEGVGYLADGSRVYFGHSIPASGAVAETAVVSADEIWPLPEGIDPRHAIALGIAGSGALLPLEEAAICPGEHVLVLGGTGPLGQIALQLARIMGAGRTVVAARRPANLDRALARGIADAAVQLGQGDDEAALRAAAAGGYDVVLDCVFGAPAEAALRTTRDGARMMSIGVGASPTMSVSLKDLVRRSHHGVGTGHRPVAERRAAYERLLGYARSDGLSVDIVDFTIDQVPAAWAALVDGPGGKIVVEVAR